VRCIGTPKDGETGAPGDVVLEVGLAIRRAGDFRVLRIAHHGNTPIVAS
jgi:hypothetical protein